MVEEFLGGLAIELWVDWVVRPWSVGKRMVFDLGEGRRLRGRGMEYYVEGAVVLKSASALERGVWLWQLTGERT